MASNSLKKYLPLGVSVLAAALGYFVTGGILQAGLLFIVAYVAVKVILTPRVRPAGEILADGVDRLDYETTLRQARAHLNSLQNEAFRVVKTDARKKLEAIASVAASIIDEVKKDPKDFRAARQFFSYYLEATVKIVKHYADLSSKPVVDEETKRSLERVEGELDAIRAGFEKQLKVLSENDTLDLDVELTVLKKTLEMEGLGEGLDAAKANPRINEEGQTQKTGV